MVDLAFVLTYSKSAPDPSGIALADLARRRTWLFRVSIGAAIAGVILLAFGAF
jgi:hypothetical protein